MKKQQLRLFVNLLPSEEHLHHQFPRLLVYYFLHCLPLSSTYSSSLLFFIISSSSSFAMYFFSKLTSLWWNIFTRNKQHTQKLYKYTYMLRCRQAVRNVDCSKRLIHVWGHTLFTEWGISYTSTNNRFSLTETCRYYGVLETFKSTGNTSIKTVEYEQ